MTNKFILYFILSVLISSCNKDVQIFNKFDLDSGQYKIFGLQTEGTPTKFVIDVGDFIISDKKTLGKIQDEWRIHLSNDRWACGTNYELYLLKADSCVDTLQINLECEFLTCRKGYFYFPADLLTKHEKSIQKISRDSAVAFRDALRTKRLFKHDVFTDSSGTIYKTSFDNLVDKSIRLIQTKELSKITDKEHVDIMMCLNTIFVHKLSDRHCQMLETVAKEKEYSKNIIKVYPEWTPNKGMGLYFKKLKMELYGTPRPSSFYNLTK